MKKIINPLVLALLIVGCSTRQEKKLVSARSDYASYLESKPTDITSLHDQISLWIGKIDKEPRGFTF